MKSLAKKPTWKAQLRKIHDRPPKWWVSGRDGVHVASQFQRLKWQFWRHDVCSLMSTFIVFSFNFVLIIYLYVWCHLGVDDVDIGRYHCILHLTCNSTRIDKHRSGGSWKSGVSASGIISCSVGWEPALQISTFVSTCLPDFVQSCVSFSSVDRFLSHWQRHKTKKCNTWTENSSKGKMENCKHNWGSWKIIQHSIFSLCITAATFIHQTLLAPIAGPPKMLIHQRNKYNTNQLQTKHHVGKSCCPTPCLEQKTTTIDYKENFSNPNIQLILFWPRSTFTTHKDVFDAW